VWAGAIGTVAVALLTFSVAARPVSGLFYICPRARVRFERCVTSIAATKFPTLEVHHSRAHDCE
jgi:hypothetical protein